MGADDTTISAVSRSKSESRYTRFESRLNELSLDIKSMRSKIARTVFQFFKVDRAGKDRWKSSLYTSMLRCDPWIAKQMASQQEARFGVLVHFISSQGTRIDIRFRNRVQSADSPGDYDACQRRVRKIKKYLGPILGPCVAKLGGITPDDKFNRVLKVLMLRAVSPSQMARLIAHGGEFFDVRYRLFDRECFAEELSSFVAADLPIDDSARADFERFLTGITQISEHGFTRAQHTEFALVTKNKTNSSDIPTAAPIAESSPDAKPDANPSRIHQKLPPCSPRTRRPARFVSFIVDAKARFEDLGEDMWVELPPLIA